MVAGLLGHPLGVKPPLLNTDNLNDAVKSGYYVSRQPINTPRSQTGLVEVINCSGFIRQIWSRGQYVFCRTKMDNDEWTEWFPLH